jgi:citrate lyase subunit beta/citryl-CoA lyase
MRSKLFVPGSRPELFAKAIAGPADGISIDLEDAVVEGRKAEARAHVGDWLRSAPRHDKLVIVRVNAMDTPHFEADLAAVVQPALHVVNLPKPDTADDVRAASAAIAKAERANGLEDGAVRLLVNIETPRALREAAALAAADPRVMGLQVGLGDLFENHAIFRREMAAVQHVLINVRFAAAEAGIEAFDGAYANTRDTEGFIEEARFARRLGFAGKSCIHPSQVPLANEAFRPSDEEIAHSLRVVEAAGKAEADGMGAWLVDGRMIDKPFLLRAQGIVAQAKRLGLVKE